MSNKLASLATRHNFLWQSVACWTKIDEVTLNARSGQKHRTVKRHEQGVAIPNVSVVVNALFGLEPRLHCRQTLQNLAGSELRCSRT